MEEVLNMSNDSKDIDEDVDAEGEEEETDQKTSGVDPRSMDLVEVDTTLNKLLGKCITLHFILGHFNIVISLSYHICCISNCLFIDKCFLLI